MYVLTELGYVLICHVKEKRKKKCSFENAFVEKSESSTRNKNGLVEGLLFSIQMFTFTDLSHYTNKMFANYNLAKFCDQLLKPLTSNDYTIKDSFSFAKEV